MVLATGYASTVEKFSLRRRVLDSLAVSDDPDIGHVAEQVLSGLSPVERDEALRQALRPFVQTVNAESRMRRPGPAPKPNRSRKVEAIREAHQKFLHERVHVGGVYKFRAELTVDDCLFAARERRELAEQNIARAVEFEAFAKALADSGVDTVGQLPQKVIRELMGT